MTIRYARRWGARNSAGPQALVWGDGCGNPLGAESIGYGADIGSIEAGKLADLVVLNSNPLTDIRRSTDIRYVMKNGELFEGATLDRVWPSVRPFPKPYWVREREELDQLRR